MARDSPSLLAACQQVQFTSEHHNCIYDAVRKEPAGHCLSTLEACAKALSLLETSATKTNNNNTQHYLEAVLQRHVDTHLINARLCAPRSVGKAARKLYEKNKRRREIELELFVKDTPITSSSSTENGAKANGSTTIRKPTESVVLDDGAVIRPLQIADAAIVDSWWDYRSEKSFGLVSRRIVLDGGIACLGVEVDGDLVACIVRYEGGALGMLHCKDEYRRRGYAIALLNHVTRTLEALGEERVAFIVDGNTASEALFTKAGWVREDPTMKKGTGKRRAKRKWIKQ